MFACRAIRWHVSTDMNFFSASEIGIQQTDGRFHTNINLLTFRNKQGLHQNQPVICNHELETSTTNVATT
jgi:hypothetical protein